MYLLIGADLVPTRSNQELFCAGDANSLLGDELQSILKGAQFRIFNLEVPLTDVESPIEKCGPNLIAPTAAINGYVAMGVNLLTLANNHILDQGIQGLSSTRNVLEERTIPYLGVGETLKEAAKPYIFAFNNKIIGIYACAEHEFSVATEKSAGANPFDPLESPDHVKALKEQCDYVIVLYHGGKEHYRYPSPGLQKNCRKLVEKGADLVVCQHSHCIGCEEKYLQGTIVYGQGNFLFDDSNKDEWKTGLLIRLEDDFTISYIPLAKSGCTVRLADRESWDEIMTQFAQRSEYIKDENAVQQEFELFAKSMQQEYLSKFLPDAGLLAKIAIKLTGGKFLKWKVTKTFSSKVRRRIQNYIECEAHNELMVQILKL